MLGKLSIAGAVAAISISTALSAQIGGALLPPSFRRSGDPDQRISGLRVRRMITVASTGTVRSQKAAPTDSEIVASMAIGAVRYPQSVVLKRSDTGD